MTNGPRRVMHKEYFCVVLDRETSHETITRERVKWSREGHMLEPPMHMSKLRCMQAS